MNNNLAEKFRLFCCKKTDRKNYIFILLAYIILLCVVSAFHEPWSDEAQAWQIARCASIYDIIFTIPHYEGHPQLWHLILVPFAKTGLPYELSIKFINILFSSLAVGVMLYKTKLPDMMKIFVPFTYFTFYQYGVISRPYSILFLGLMLCAAAYEKRDEKPAPFVLSMLLLCLSTAYGMAIACGMCIVWIIKYLRMGSLKKALSAMAKNGVLAGLSVMLIFAVMLLIFILPASDCFNSVLGSTKADALSSLIYGVFGTVYDATIGNLFNSDVGLANIEVIGLKLFYIIPISILVWLAIIAFGKKKGKLCEFLIPFILLTLSFILIRMGGHHIGIITLLMLYWVCICSGSDDTESHISTRNVKIINNILMAVMCIVIFVQLMWSVLSVISDIKYNYSIGREAGQFVIDENITDNSTFAYTYFISNKTNMYDSKELIMLDYSLDAVSILPYADGNIFFNLNYGDDSKAYISNKHLSKSDYYDEIEVIKSQGVPEYIFGTPLVCDLTKKSTDDFWEIDSRSYNCEFDYYFKEHKYTICKTISYKENFKGSGILYYYDIYRLADNGE